MKHSSTPAWSLGVKTDAEPKTSDKYNPGPGTYELRSDSQPLLPSGKFGVANRPDFARSNEVPGPGQYNPARPVGFQGPVSTDKKQKRGVRGSGRDKPDKAKMETPGPSAYNPKYLHGAPQYSLGNKTYGLPALNPEEVGLGPGQYNPNLRSVQSTKIISFGKGQRPDLYRADPEFGARNYNVEPPRGGRQYSFGKTPVHGKLHPDSGPAPGSYNIPSFTDHLQGKGKTMSAKFAGHKADGAVPGPGAYHPHPTASAPAFSMGKGNPRGVRPKRESSSSALKGELQAPEAYLSSFGKRGTSFGRGKRQPLSQTMATPGPGEYEARHFLGNGPKYGVAGRKPAPKSMVDPPGPGHYAPNMYSVKPEGATHVIGTGLRSNAGRTRPKTNPGPGHYYKPPTYGGGWTFGKDPRDRTEFDDEPGPGEYEIPPTVPDVPKYLMPSSNPYVSLYD